MSENHSIDSVEYRPVPGYPGYRVGDDGSMWSCRAKNGKGRKPTKWHMLSVYYNTSGYVNITLRRNEGGSTIQIVSRLVLMAFVGPCSKGMECRHLDGNRDNNYLTNLAWGTHAENVADTIRHGTLRRGEQCSSTKLTASDVRAIRRLAASGHKYAALARVYSVTTPAIWQVVHRKTWKHID